MRVPMRVRLAGWIVGIVTVLMMLVMTMRVCVAERRVLMLVLMLLGKMEAHADAHEHSGNHELETERLTQPNHCNDRPDERRRGIVCTGPGSPESTQGDHE